MAGIGSDGGSLREARDRHARADIALIEQIVDRTGKSGKVVSGTLMIYALQKLGEAAGVREEDPVKMSECLRSLGWPEAWK